MAEITLLVMSAPSFADFLLFEKRVLLGEKDPPNCRILVISPLKFD